MDTNSNEIDSLKLNLKESVIYFLNKFKSWIASHTSNLLGFTA